MLVSIYVKITSRWNDNNANKNVPWPLRIARVRVKPWRVETHFFQHALLQVHCDFRDAILSDNETGVCINQRNQRQWLIFPTLHLQLSTWFMIGWWWCVCSHLAHFINCPVCWFFVVPPNGHWTNPFCSACFLCHILGYFKFSYARPTGPTASANMPMRPVCHICTYPIYFGRLCIELLRDLAPFWLSCFWTQITGSGARAELRMIQGQVFV